MTFLEIIALFIAAGIAGAINSVAGGGSFISFPTILFFGVPPITANATNGLALTPGTLASALAYRKLLSQHRPTLIRLAGVSLAGGVAGAFLLLRTPQTTFVWLLPYLMLVATLLFIFNSFIIKRVRQLGMSHDTRAGMIIVLCLQFFIAIYGGYFGGGQGILILAVLSMLGLSDIHAMNGLKTLIAAIINGSSAIAFIVANAIAWPEAIVMTLGAILGGYLGAHYAQRVPPRLIRIFIIGIGAALTIYFFIR